MAEGSSGLSVVGELRDGEGKGLERPSYTDSRFTKSQSYHVIW